MFGTVPNGGGGNELSFSVRSKGVFINTLVGGGAGQNGGGPKKFWVAERGGPKSFQQ